jgi:hypothetical protein
MVVSMAARIIVRIELTPDAKRRLMDISKRFGMTQISATSRLVEWFAGQSELIQAAILGQYPAEIESDVAKLILQKMAGTASSSK